MRVFCVLPIYNSNFIKLEFLRVIRRYKDKIKYYLQKVYVFSFNFFLNIKYYYKFSSLKSNSSLLF